MSQKQRYQRHIRNIRDLAQVLALSGLCLEASDFTYLDLRATIHKMGTVIMTSENLIRVQKHACGMVEYHAPPHLINTCNVSDALAMGT